MFNAPTFLLAGPWVHQTRELREYIRHLITPLAAPDVYDDVRVAPFGDGVLGHGFSRAKSSGDGHRSTFWNGEQAVDYPLAGHERSTQLRP